MEQEAIAGYQTESKAWRAALAEKKERLLKSQKELLEIAIKKLSNDDLKELEHFQNSFYIQLINIHDVKKDLRHYESAVNHNDPDVQQTHDNFREEFNNQINILDSLDAEFEEYKQKPH